MKKTILFILLSIIYLGVFSQTTCVESSTGQLVNANLNVRGTGYFRDNLRVCNDIRGFHDFYLNNIKYTLKDTLNGMVVTYDSITKKLKWSIPNSEIPKLIQVINKSAGEDVITQYDVNIPSTGNINLKSYSSSSTNYGGAATISMDGVVVSFKDSINNTQNILALQDDGSNIISNNLDSGQQSMLHITPEYSYYYSSNPSSHGLEYLNIDTANLTDNSLVTKGYVLSHGGGGSQDLQSVMDNGSTASVFTSFYVQSNVDAHIEVDKNYYSSNNSDLDVLWYCAQLFNNDTTYGQSRIFVDSTGANLRHFNNWEQTSLKINNAQSVFESNAPTSGGITYRGIDTTNFVDSTLVTKSYVLAHSNKLFTLTGNNLHPSNTSNYINSEFGIYKKNTLMVDMDTIKDNVVFGYNGLISNTTGVSNTAIGTKALRNNTTGTYNTGIGYTALATNYSGNNNTSVGSGSLFKNYDGIENSALGVNSLTLNTDGYDNTAMGYASMYYNTHGAFNTAMGRNSLYSNTGGVNNTSIGNASMQSNVSGNYNSAIGNTSLYTNSNGWWNNSFGLSSLYSNTSGSNNNAFGAFAGYRNTTGSYNISIGDSAGVWNTTADSTLSIGKFKVTKRDSTENIIWAKMARKNPRIHLNGRTQINGSYWLPKTDSISGKVLMTNGNGKVYWGTASGGSSTVDTTIISTKRYARHVADSINQLPHVICEKSLNYIDFQTYIDPIPIGFVTKTTTIDSIVIYQMQSPDGVGSTHILIGTKRLNCENVYEIYDGQAEGCATVLTTGDMSNSIIGPNTFLTILFINFGDYPVNYMYLKIYGH